jgi:Fe-S-cluster containining protein
VSLPDFDDLKRLRRMGRKMASLFETLDPEVAKAIEPLNVSCKTGCAGCCYLLTLVSLPEAVSIAEYFLSDKERRNLIPLLMRSFWEQVQHIPPGNFKAIRQAYFQKKVPCTFLDEETKLCTIYPVRPGACRFHFVVSDPVLCQPERGIQSVGHVNTLGVEAQVLSEANRVSNQTKMPLFIAPLPVVMLWAFKLLIEGRAAFDAALKEENGVMGLNVWMEMLHGDEAPPAVTTPETPAQKSD